MAILPLPQFEADMEAARIDAEAYAKLATPKTLVVRFGVMKLVGEYPYDGDAKPGCGSKIVVRTHRGTEMGEMLTSTCPNAGCSKSVTRQEMLEYIDNSGGKDYPFFTEGRALRVATIDDMNQQSRLEAQKPAMLKFARETAAEMLLPMKVVEVEPILGGERVTFYYTSEDRIDFRDLVHALASQYHTRIELRQVGARDEARLIADYEKCGQHCCCKQFLKVLKPISIKAAKTQKATLDPLKISGRCGRLMCCLRYEDQTYEELNKRLPKMKKRIGTPHGVGIVVDRQILTQLVLVRLEHDNTQVAVPAEEVMPVEQAPQVGGPAPASGAKPGDPLRGMSPQQVQARLGGGRPGGPSGPGRSGGPAGPATGGPGAQRDGAGRSETRRDEGASDGVAGEMNDRQRFFRERDREEQARRAGGTPPVENDADEESDSVEDGDAQATERRDGGGAGGAPGGAGGPGQPGEGGRRRRRRGRGRGPRPEGGAGGPGAPGGNPQSGAPRPEGSPPPQPRRDGPSSGPGGGGQGGGGGGSGGGGGGGGKRRRRRRGPPFGGGGGGSGGGGGPFGG